MFVTKACIDFRIEEIWKKIKILLYETNELRNNYQSLKEKHNKTVEKYDEILNLMAKQMGYTFEQEDYIETNFHMTTICNSKEKQIKQRYVLKPIIKKK